MSQLTPRPPRRDGDSELVSIVPLLRAACAAPAVGEAQSALQSVSPSHCQFVGQRCQRGVTLRVQEHCQCQCHSYSDLRTVPVRSMEKVGVGVGKGVLPIVRAVVAEGEVAGGMIQQSPRHRFAVLHSNVSSIAKHGIQPCRPLPALHPAASCCLRHPPHWNTHLPGTHIP